MEEDDEEIVIKRPKTPLSNRNRRLTIETPEVDLERFRPQRFNLDATNPLVSSTYYSGKVNSVQEACAKYFAVHILKFEILQITLKQRTDP